MSIIIKMFCYFILQVTLLLSVLFLLRGHNYPGGGFIGALIACTGIGFYCMAYRKPPPFIENKHIILINVGIICLLLSLILPIFVRQQIFTGLWGKIDIFGYVFKPGTPLLFDTGIYLSVMGGVVWIMTYLESKTYD